MGKLRIGVIGVGNMGARHVETLAQGKIKNAVLTGVCDIDSKRLKNASRLAPEAAAYKSADELIASGNQDAVIIATPHYSHPEISKKALIVGLHVLSEKPVGVYTKNVRETVELAKSLNKTYAVMFNQRTNPIYIKTRELVKSGEYGDLRRVEWTITDWYRTEKYYESGSWRATWDGEGGGVLMNQAPHNLDLWQWICGMPVRVTAFCKEGAWHKIEVEDDVTVYAEYKNGATGVFVSSTGDFPGENRLVITLDRAKIVTSPDDISLYELDMPISEYTKKAEKGFSHPNVKLTKIPYSGDNPQHPGVIEAFCSSVLSGSPLIADAGEALLSLSLSNAAYLSSWLNEPVDLPIDEDLYLKELNKKRAASKKKESVKEELFDDISNSFGSKRNGT